MRLISITVRNYRIHRELTVALDPARTVIGGPNESGKSTLAEAVHRALFLRARGNREEHRAMRSDLFGGNPQVEVRFEAGGSEYTVAKTFGASGTTLLNEAGGNVLHDSDAEQRLLELLQADSPGANPRELLNHWGHLWAWQGEVTKDPIRLANAKSDELVTLLQSEGGAVLQTSPRDRQVANDVSASVTKTFTNRGEPRAQSALGMATRDDAAAKSSLDQAKQQFDKLERAIIDFREAGQILTKQEEIMSRQEAMSADLEERGVEINRLQAEKNQHENDANSARDKYDELLNADTSIKDCRQDVEELEAALAPGREALAKFEDAKKKAAADLQAAHTSLDQAHEDARAIREHRDLAKDYVELVKLAGELAAKEKVWNQSEELRQTIEDCQKELARLPEMDTDTLNNLQELETGASTLETKLDATAARIELLASEVDVSVDGSPLAPGTPEVITSDTEISVGEVARLKISPGGGDDLDALHQQAAQTRKDFNTALADAGVKSVGEAVEVRAKRESFSTQQQNAEAERSGLGGDAIKPELDRLNAQHETLRETLEGKLEQARDFQPPGTQEAAATLEKSLSANLAGAEATESTRRAQRDAHNQEKTKADEKETAKRDEISGQGNDLNKQQAKLDALIKIHGDDKPRAERVQSLLQKKNDADQQLKQTETELSKLQPKSYQDDLDRNQRALKKAEDAKKDAVVLQGIAKGTLATDGSVDPKAELESAQLRAQSAQTRLANEQRQANAKRLLDQLFREQKQSIDDQYGDLLAGKVTSYLGRLYGDETSATIESDEDGFAGLSIDRSTLDGRSFAFDILSGGTQEQTAAALRLAMAEILAAGHDGCLPVVLDDAFANSDPNRIERVQAMLDHAAVRGLQVIVLTCNPAEYAGLGAETVILQGINNSQANAPVSITPAEASSLSIEPAPSTSEPAVDRKTQFLEALTANGGKLGNKKLAEILSWTEADYEATKQTLITTGKIKPGKGRGGSVILV